MYIQRHRWPPQENVRLLAVLCLLLSTGEEVDLISVDETVFLALEGVGDVKQRVRSVF